MQDDFKRLQEHLNQMNNQRQGEKYFDMPVVTHEEVEVVQEGTVPAMEEEDSD